MYYVIFNMADMERSLLRTDTLFRNLYTLLNELQRNIKSCKKMLIQSCRYCINKYYELLESV